MSSSLPSSSLSSVQIRQSFLDFFVRDHHHTEVPSASVVPCDSDPSLLFVTAGMNQFKSLILGTCPMDDWRFPLKRVVNSQKCLRAGGKHNDLQDVGRDTTHHTFFEMLGNWSFGDYYKREACTYAWQYITEILGLPPDRIYVTYFGGDQNLGLDEDTECREIWKRIGVDPSRILRFGYADNFWEMSDTGPCGPCSEIHFDTIGNRCANDLVNKSDGGVVELWNLVFMQYNRSSSGQIRPLPRRHIDCGMGFERLVSIIQQVPSSYETDIFAPLIAEICKYANKSGQYGGLVGEADIRGRDTAYRIVADHLRAICIAISDGVRPDATGRGYVLRRMLRRAARVSSTALEADRGLLTALVPAFITFMKPSFPELVPNANLIKDVISSEEHRFWQVVERGEKMFEQEAERSSKQGTPFSGEVAWYLHNTHGFPVELTSLLAEEKNLEVDLSKFEECRNQAKELRSMKDDENGYWCKAQVEAFGDRIGLEGSNDGAKYDYKRLEDGKYLFPEKWAKVMGIFDEEGTSVGKLEPNTKGCLLLDETVFFAEQGGQTADHGTLFDGETTDSRDEIFRVEDVQRKKDFVLLIGRTAEHRTLECGMRVVQRIDEERRLGLMRAHTGTHLLLDGLRRVLMDHSIFQKGSHLLPDTIRFDCTLQRPLSEEELEGLEQIIGEQIQEERRIFIRNIQRSELSTVPNLQSNITASFTEATNSSGSIRIVSVGDWRSKAEATARAIECCCGTHLVNTVDLGSFVLISQKSLGAGVRRIVAFTGYNAEKAVEKSRRLEEILETSTDFGEIDTNRKELVLLEKDLKTGQLPLLRRNHLQTALKEWKKNMQRRRRNQSMVS